MKLDKNIVLVDNSEEKVLDFKDGLQSSTNKQWTIYVNKSNKLQKNLFDRIIRYIKYFLFPFKIFLGRKNVENIVAWQQFYGILYAFYCNLFKVKKSNSLVIMTFIYKEKKFLGKLYYIFIKYAIDNNYVDYIICFSKNECEYYARIFNMNPEKFVFLKLGIDKININMEYDEKNYIIAPGRSNRDYKFLIESLKDENYNVKIICDSIPKKKDGKIQIYTDVMGDKYFSMLKNADCVIIPLKDDKISSGQLVILQSMQLKIPIIVTESLGIRDYIKDGYNGIIINKNKKDLLNALKLLEDKDFRQRIVDNAYRDYLEKYSLDSLGKKIGKIINRKG